MDTVADNLARIRERMDSACVRAGRSPDDVRLMAVSKRQSPERLAAAVACGLRLFGESRVQESVQKWDLFPPDATVHLIGHLQRNKARDAARMYHAVDSIDAERTAVALNDRLTEVDRRMPVLLEVNTSGEESKQGVDTFDDLRRLVDATRSLDRITVAGLMTIGPISSEEARLRGAFAQLRDFRDRLVATFPELDLAELSMGMSNDLEYAILEGATTVRVGTALFGVRDR